MYCPNCGTSTSLDQKFCRGCGLNLSPVSQMLTNSPEPRPEATGPSQVRVLDIDRRRIFRWTPIIRVDGGGLMKKEEL